LPPQELNPLVNPLLSANMGRWAEVYFTSPPEKREEAIVELLRELQAETSQNQDQLNAIQSDIASHPVNTSSSAAHSLKAVALVCEACGETNAAEQRFCGSCGAALAEGEAYSDTGRHNSFPSRSTLPAQWQETAPFFPQESAREEARTPVELDKILYRDDGERRNWLPGDYAPKLIPEYKRGPYQYRLYIGVVFAALLGYLAYTGWRQTRSWSENSHPLPKPAPAAETQPAPPPTSPVRAKVETGEPSTIAQNPDPARKQDTGNHLEADSRTDGENKEPVSKAVLKSPLSAKGSALQENGSQELTVAENYLNGAQGKARDSGEAAKWLWQSVRKGNTAATLLLSDLYLKGDGVLKNCDQARLLLDAASRKGSAGAAERLRNLPAFGCQ
jgi:hypothetical protein